MDTGQDWFVNEPTLLKALLKVRHWQKRDTFARKWDSVAKKIDSRLAGSCPAHAQFYRWLNGKIRSMPQPDACRILEAMFPDFTVQQLFQPAQESREQLQAAATFETCSSSAQISHREPDDSVIGAIEAGLNARIIRSELTGTASRGAITAYSMRGLISRPKWNDTIRDCKENLWLYGMAELGYALDDEVPKILNAAAKAGCDIRILLLDPDYRGITDIDADEGSPPGTLSSRIRAALARFWQISKTCDEQMRIRVYNAPPAVSIVRGDSRMLVTPYLRFFVGSNSPSLELQYTSAAGELFDRYTRHFQRTWDLAKEYAE